MCNSLVYSKETQHLYEKYVYYDEGQYKQRVREEKRTFYSGLYVFINGKRYKYFPVK